MDSTKNFIEAWANTQSQLVNNILDTSHKIRKGFSVEAGLKQSSELYKNWFSDQQHLIENLYEKVKEQTEDLGFAPFLKNWLESQVQFVQNLLQFQQKNNPGESKFPFDNFQKIQESLGTMLNQMFHQFGSPLPNMEYTPGNFTQESFKTMFDGSKVLTQMFEVWQPIYQLMHKQNPDMKAFGEVFDWKKYQDVVLTMFKPYIPSGLESLPLQFEQLFKLYPLQNSGGMDMMGGFIEQFKSASSKFSPSQSLNYLVQIHGQMRDQFQKAAAPYKVMIPAGKEKMFMTLTEDLLETSFQYVFKAMEMQNVLLSIAQPSLEKVITQLWSKINLAEGKFITFDEFYVLWVDTLEKDITNLFGGETFAKLQGEMLSLRGRLKQQLDKIIELILAPFPVAPRSALDELNKTLYDLKEKVQILEERLEEKNNPVQNGVSKESSHIVANTEKSKTTARKTTTNKKNV